MRAALVAGVLAAVCGRTMAAPISLPSQIDFSQTELAPASEPTADTRMISLLEFPETPDTDNTPALDLVATDLPAALPVAAAANDDDGIGAPEPSTALTLMVGLLLTGAVFALRRKILCQEHRPFRRRVRREHRMMA
jgi:hypothetical protein